MQGMYFNHVLLHNKPPQNEAYNNKHFIRSQFCNLGWVRIWAIFLLIFSRVTQVDEVIWWLNWGWKI